MKRAFETKAAFGLMLAAGVMVGNASGEMIITPTGAVLLGDTGNFTGGTIQSGSLGWINGAGLQGGAEGLPSTFDTSDVEGSLATLASHTYGNIAANGGRIRQNTPFAALPTVTFTLDGPTDLTGLILWNHGEGPATGTESGRGWSAADLSFTTAADPLAEDAVFTGLESLTFTQGPQGGVGNTFVIRPEFDLFSAAAIGVTGVRFSNIDTFLGTPETGIHLLNVSEIRFTGAPSVVIPEPSSFALLALAGAGLVGRRRTRTTNPDVAV